MKLGQLLKIIEVVKNGGVVLADKYTETGYSDTHEITEFSDIEDILNYAKESYRFYIKAEDGRPWYELEEIR